MAFKIPFSISPIEKLKRNSQSFKRFFKHRKDSNLDNYLQNLESGLTREEYLAICLRGFIFKFVGALISIIIVLILLKFGGFIEFTYPVVIIVSFIIALIFSGFIFVLQIMYPRLLFNRKQKEIERNLIPALQDMLVQLNSGIPLFSILVNLSSSNYSTLSEEFKKIVKKINSGFSQAEVIEEVGDKNPSMHFRRALWQISNGMRAGSDISIIVKESVKTLNEEQVLQIQSYGNKLNPMIMFYMLIAVILPALAITFLTIITSLINLPALGAMLLFIGIGIVVLFIQIMFLGTIRSLRPTLL